MLPRSCPPVGSTPITIRDKLYNAFVQDEIPIVGDQLSLTIGSKFLHNGYSGFEIEPTARLLWTPSSRQTVWVAVTRAVRTPSRIEEDLQLTGLAAPTPLTFFRIIGDRKFSSERPDWVRSRIPKSGGAQVPRGHCRLLQQL